MATLSELITASDDTPPSSQLGQAAIPHHHTGVSMQQPGGMLSASQQQQQQQQQQSSSSNLMRMQPDETATGSPNVDRMPQLKQLMLSADEDITRPSQTFPAPIRTAEECVDDLLSEGAPPDSALGQAVDNLFVSWNQLILDLSARPGFTVPTAEHIKEVAECTIRQLKDSCQELTGELAKVGLEWRLSHPEEALAEDLTNYDQAIMRQQTLIGRAAGIMQRRLDDFANESSSEL